jgi:hypothetical protein
LQILAASPDPEGPQWIERWPISESIGDA